MYSFEGEYGIWTHVDQRNHILVEGPDSPWERAVLRGKGSAHCKV